MRVALRLWLLLAAWPALVVAKEPVGDRLHALVFARTDAYGDSFSHMVDVPLWSDTRYLLEGDSHIQLKSMLEELSAEPLDETAAGQRRRALVQHELWQIFDWLVESNFSEKPATRALRKQVAAAMRRIALSKEQIESLPGNLTSRERSRDADNEAPNVLDDSLGWISVGLPDSTPIALSHLDHFRGRSTFGVFFRHADGPREARAFIERLKAVPFPLKRAEFGPGIFEPNLAVPQFPVGTKLALLRRMMLIDQRGKPVGSPVVQSLQLRTILKIDPDEPRALPDQVRMQEFTLARERYLAGEKNALRTIGPKDRARVVFKSHNHDFFQDPSWSAEDRQRLGKPGREQPLVLQNCFGCHRDQGALSMNSYTRAFSAVLSKNPEIKERSFADQIKLTSEWKTKHDSWKRLREDWDPASK